MWFFKKKDKRKIDPERVPAHIGFIMDGNGRWAKKRGLPRSAGHKAGVDALNRVAKACREYGVKSITLYTLSIDNFKRDPKEINYIFDLIEQMLDEKMDTFLKEGIQLRVIGNLDFPKLRKSTSDALKAAIEKTKDCNKFHLNLAIAYSGTDELVRAFKRMVADGSEITEEQIKNHLDTAGLPDLDLVVRSSGEIRLSGFLLYQVSYSELYFVQKHWPDFDADTVKECILEYQSRNRRFGNAK